MATLETDFKALEFFKVPEPQKPTHGFKNECPEFYPSDEESEDSLNCDGCGNDDHCHEGYNNDARGCDAQGVSACDNCSDYDNCHENDEPEEDEGMSWQEFTDLVWGEDYEGEIDWDDPPGFHD